MTIEPSPDGTLIVMLKPDGQSRAVLVKDPENLRDAEIAKLFVNELLGE